MNVMQILQEYKVALIALAVVIVAAFASVVQVPETEQAVVLRNGDPVGVINPFRPTQDFGQTGAGLVLRIPFVERLVRIDRRLLTVDTEPQQVLSSDQARLQVDAGARFRIIDPVRMVRTVGTTDRLQEQLRPILTSALRQELGKRTMQSLLTTGRGQAMTQVRLDLDQQARQYGAQVVDVRLTRADLPEGALDAAYTRMQAAREQDAANIRAQGQKQVQIIQAQAEADAARIYAQSFGKDPKFYDFYRAMQSYRTAFTTGNGSTTILLSPENSYLKEFKQP